MDTRQLQQSMLFRGMTELEITKALQVLEAHEKSFQKGETLLIAGTITERMGLVLEGSVTIESNDAWGNRTIISHVGQGQVFAETYALLENEPMLVDVTAQRRLPGFLPPQRQNSKPEKQPGTPGAKVHHEPPDDLHA